MGTDSVTRLMQSAIWIATVAILGAACATLPPTGASSPPAPAPSRAIQNAGVLGPYFDLLAELGPGDTARQGTALAAARIAWEAGASPQNSLRYGLALGTPGHLASNPAEASRLLAQLLNRPDGLSPDEINLARAFLREFEARLALYAELAREREFWEGRLRSSETDARATSATYAAESARLRRERDALQEKLDAITEIERSLMERDAEPVPPPREQP